MKILGISAFYHDSAAALVVDGQIAAAAQEERFSRRKHDSRFPHFAIEYCLKEAGLRAGDLDSVVFYDKPFLKFERLLETYLMLAPEGIFFLPHGAAAMDSGKAVSKKPDSFRAQEIRSVTGLDKEASLYRASFESRG